MLAMVAVVDELITAEPRTRRLTVILGTNLSWNDHGAKVCNTSQFHLRNISEIGKFLTKNSTEILSCAFVS